MKECLYSAFLPSAAISIITAVVLDAIRHWPTQMEILHLQAKFMLAPCLDIWKSLSVLLSWFPFLFYGTWLNFSIHYHSRSCDRFGLMGRKKRLNLNNLNLYIDIWGRNYTSVPRDRKYELAFILGILDLPQTDVKIDITIVIEKGEGSNNWNGSRNPITSSPSS